VPLIHPIQRRHNKPPANGNRRPAERKRDETESLIVRHPWATCFSCAAGIKALMRRRQRGRKAGGPDFPSSEKMPPNLDRQRTGSTGLGTIWRGGYESGATVGGTGTEEWKQMWGKRYRTSPVSRLTFASRRQSQSTAPRRGARPERSQVSPSLDFFWNRLVAAWSFPIGICHGQADAHTRLMS